MLSRYFITILQSPSKLGLRSTLIQSDQQLWCVLQDFEIDDQQFHLIKYLQSAALVNIGTYEDIVKAIQLLCEMEVYEYSIPALHVQLARAYCKLNR